MKGLLPAMVMSTLASVCAEARTATAAERAACVAKIQPKIDAIDARLRAGYSARDGERLLDQQRKLEDARDKCRIAPR